MIGLYSVRSECVFRQEETEGTFLPMVKCRLAGNAKEARIMNHCGFLYVLPAELKFLQKKKVIIQIKIFISEEILHLLL